MTTTFEAVRSARWLTNVVARFPGYRPVLLCKPSRWNTVIAGALLGSDTLTLLGPRAIEGESLRLDDIVTAHVVEDANERYSIELRLRPIAQKQPTPAVLCFDDDAFFLLFFAALSNAAVGCTFGFTDRRLAQLGARKVKA